MDWARHLRLAKEGSWILVGQLATVLGSLVLVRVVTKYLEPGQYGQLALGLTIAGLVNQVIMGGIISGIGRFYSVAAREQGLGTYWRASQRLMLYATLAVLALSLAVISALFLLGYSEWLALAAAILALSILSGYNSALNAIQNAARRRAIVAFHGGVDAWLRIVLAVSVLFWLGNSSTAVVLGYALSSLLVTGSQFIFLPKIVGGQNRSTEHDSKWTREIWAYSWPMAVGGLFSWGYYASQRWALEFFTTTDTVGHFYALTQIAYTPISMAGAMFLSFLTPILFSRVGDATDEVGLSNTQSIVMRLAAIGVGITLLIAIASYFVHETIFGFMVAPQYRGISHYMPYVVIAAGLLQVSQTIGAIILVRQKTLAILPLAICGQFYIASQNLISTYFLGLTGLLISMITGALLHLGWMTAIVHRLSRS